MSLYSLGEREATREFVPYKNPGSASLHLGYDFKIPSARISTPLEEQLQKNYIFIFIYR